MKTCSKCNIEKPLSEFHKRSDSKDGRRNDCILCKRLSNTSYRINNVDKEKKRHKIYNNDNKDKIRKWRESNKAVLTEKRKQYYLNNIHDIRYKNGEYKKNNRERYNSLGAKRRSSKLHRTPKWADLDAIREFYKNCPKGYHVDHIIPLQGKNVSGLHVLGNLQYLTAEENIKKGNKYDGNI